MKLVEDIVFDDCEFVEEAGVQIIKNVCLLGSESKNGYSYSLESMRAAVAAGLYENCRSYVGHKEGNRDLRDLCGVFKNTRFESNKVKGDAHLLATESGRLFWSIARDAPSAAACSHVASGKLTTRNGERIVERIEKVFSVDLVADGATNKGLFESQVISENAPKPGVDETQPQYTDRAVRILIARGVAAEQATEMAFETWTRRFQPDGTTDIIEEPPTGEEDEIETVTLTRAEEPRKESDMKTMSEELREYERTKDEISNLIDLDDGKEQIIRRHVAEQRHADYLAGQEQARRDRQSATRIAEEIFARGNIRESDAEFQQRCSESRRIREQTERDAKRIAEEVLPVGGLIG